MASFLQVENLTKSYGDRMLFADITFGVDEGDKIGIVAKNGTGKSTLLNIIAGRESADSGTVTFRNGLRVSMVEQSPVFAPGSTVIEAALTDGGPLADTVTAYEQALASGDAAATAAAIHAMDTASAWDYEDRLKQLLTRLHLDDTTAMVDTLSGGQRKRLALARALMQSPDLIILDEPTNHLDIEVIEWLENYLKRSRVTLLMVTHDRYFLDRVCNRIIEMDHSSIFIYDGNYDYYLRRRRERIEALTAEVAKVRNTLRKEQEWMSRQPQARAGKAKYRIDRYYDLKERSRADYSERDLSLDVRSAYIGSKIFEAEGISKSFGQKVILDDFTYTFARFEKVGIVGHNGVGKSTFVKMLQGLVKPDSGSWNVGETVRFGYYSQDGIAFVENKKVIDAVTEITDDVTVNGEHFSPMQFLSRFMFSVPDQQKYIHTLSGGERARLHLATVLMRQPNFLILDEPTNDLDIVTLGILEDYLASFKGCAIIISHDRYFLDNIVDHLFVMKGDGVVLDFPGGYSDYHRYEEERRQLEQQEQRDKARRQAEAAPRKPREQRSPRLSYKEKRELEALTAEIDTLTAEKAALEALFNSGEAIADIAERSARYTEVSALLDEKELRWLELSEQE